MSDRRQQTNGVPASVPGERRLPDGERGPTGSAAEARRTVMRMAAASAREPYLLMSPDVAARLDAPISRQVMAVRAEARAAVAAYVVALRQDTVPPQRMLVLVKQIVREAAGDYLNGADVVVLMSDVVRWSIEAYYEG